MPIHQPNANPSVTQSSGELTINQLNLMQIDKLVGGTPYYAYDKVKVTHIINELSAALPEKIKLHYAIKANPYPSLVHHMATLVAGFDVASTKEMLLAMQTGMPVEEISFAGPGKSDDDLQSAIIAGVTLHIESTTELARVQTIAQALQKKAQIALRINPEFELKSSGMKMSGGAKPFGIDEEEVESILKDLSLSDIKLRGFHIFAGSQNLNEQALIECHEKTFALAQKLIKFTSSLSLDKLDYINIGGGLGVPYFNNEKPLELSNICKNLQELLAKYQTELSQTEIIMELGRYLVASAGIYVAKVIDKKTSRGTNYLVCDGGLHHHLANSGNFGQVIRKNYPVALYSQHNKTIENSQKVTVVGPLCTPLDILADKVTLPKAKVGDYFVVFQSGAYGASASPKDFLSQPEVKEILL